MKEKHLTFEQVQYYTGKKDPNYEYDSDEEDSMFGSFNPNLRTKDVASGSRASLLITDYKHGSNEIKYKFEKNRKSSMFGQLYLE